MLTTLLAQHALLLSLCLGVSATYTAAPTVTIADGVLHGTTSLLPSATAAVNQFLGVPFAASPPRRFEPPTKPQQWTTPKKVQNFTAACVQQFDYPEIRREIVMEVFNGPGGPMPAESEDCLYLNVYVPSTPPPVGGRAVMFWIFGGAFQFGTAMQVGYDGSSFAYNQDVIVVVPNYRTNVFGFSSAPQLPLTSRNAGLLDQRQALHWVQNNIASFGGDPNKVTIFGESAGAASVDRLVTTMGKNPPFRAAIMESGQATYGSLAANVAQIGVASWNSLVSMLNCTGNATSAAAFSCVQRANATLIKSIIEHNSLSFAPVPDNLTQLSNPVAAYSSGKAAKVPLLQGTNRQEGNIFTLGMTNLTGFLESTITNGSERSAIAAAFPVTGNSTQAQTISDIFTKLTFSCPQSALVDLAAKSGYTQYEYLYDASFNNTNPLYNLGINLGVFHSSEIGLVFGTYPRANSTAQEVVLSNYMQTAWANFAKHPERGPGWNAIGTYSGIDLAVLGGNGTSGATMQNRNVVDNRCALFRRLIQSDVATPSD